MTSSAGVKNLLVDLDGTLVDYHSFRTQAKFVWSVLQTALRYGSAYQAIRALRYLASQSTSQGLDLSNRDRAAQYLGHLYGVTSSVAAQNLDKALIEIFPRLKSYFSPIPGAQEFIEWAASRYELVLATNPVWPEEVIRLRLSWSGIDPNLFRSVTHYGRMSACKPWKNYYLSLLDQEGFNPSETVMIGNEMKMDFPAVEVGLAVWIVENSSEVKRIGDRAFAGSFPQLKHWLESEREEGGGEAP